MDTVGRVPRSGPAGRRGAEPFQSIESAHEFLALLGETIEDALEEVQQELAACTMRQEPRQVDAWRVVLFTTTKLGTHVATSRRLLNDLRTLRNLLHRREMQSTADDGTPATPATF